MYFNGGCIEVQVKGEVNSRRFYFVLYFLLLLFGVDFLFLYYTTLVLNYTNYTILST